jgi:hypothetical protein
MMLFLKILLLEVMLDLKFVEVTVKPSFFCAPVLP